MLTQSLDWARETGSIRRINSLPWPNAMVILHYADDTLLLAPNDTISLSKLKYLRYAFELLGGLKINFDKSYIYNLVGMTG